MTELYACSLLVLKLHGDWQGGGAANDSDVVLYNRDTYSYVWPRNGALAAQAFDSAGYPFTAQLFYEFTARAISREELWVRGVVGGMARYDGDVYHRADDGVPGNPWVICTLWLADWFAQIADSEAKLAGAVALLEWVARHALPSVVLPEQIDPGTGKPLSVAPLAGSDEWLGRLYAQMCKDIHDACKTA